MFLCRLRGFFFVDGVLSKLATWYIAGMNEVTLHSMLDEMAKLAKVITELQPHQQRVVERLKEQEGLVAAHGLGSGKTLSSIAAQQELGLPTQVLVPAALQANYLKELKKHVRGGDLPEVSSLQRAALRGDSPSAPFVVVDEAHRLRDPSSKSRGLFAEGASQKRLLLTGTPFYNDPSDIAPLVNIVAGERLLPEDKTSFYKQYVKERKVSPGLLKSLIGVKKGVEHSLNPAEKENLRAVLQKWVDYHGNDSSEYLPEVTKEDVSVPMSEGQLRVHDTLLRKAPLSVRMKVKAGLPPSKSEATSLNAFLSGARQASTSTAPFIRDPTKGEHPKLDVAFSNLKKSLEENDRAKAVVYSNFLQSGVTPYRDLLHKANIPFGELTGEKSKAERSQAVQDYNADKLRVLLMSSAGGEGLDLKGTRLVQLLEPHWNEPKLEQVEGRGARFGSHAHLPKEERKLHVQRYLSTRPPSRFNQWFGTKPGLSTDEYLNRLAANKELLIDQFRELIRTEGLTKS